MSLNPPFEHTWLSHTHTHDANGVYLGLQLFGKDFPAKDYFPTVCVGVGNSTDCRNCCHPSEKREALVRFRFQNEQIMFALSNRIKIDCSQLCLPISFFRKAQYRDDQNLQLLPSTQQQPSEL